ncbi:MAG: NAD-dependent deacylase [Anaerolineales bacterium]
MPPLIDADLITRAAGLIKSAGHAVALTGAGISTPSGIPDFRSSGSGLWTRYDPMSVASLTAFRTHPGRFYDWVYPFAKTVMEAEPNPAHIALARLEAAHHLSGIVTQNIDDLHGRAGSKVVFEIHGHFREATCGSCYKRFSSEGLLEKFVKTGEVPRCPECGGVLKPNMVLFGEQLPHEVIQPAQKLMDESDLIIVAGSSLEVTPAAIMPIAAINNGAKLIIVNHDVTYLNPRADVVFQADVADILPMLVDEVLSDG